MSEPSANGERAELHAALAKAQGEFPPIPKTKTATVQMKSGGTYKYSYADLPAILDAVRPHLAANGLAVTQRLESPNGQPSLRTELLHESGGAIAGSYPLGADFDTPQQFGSALTYLRRYALTALLGIAADDDDDGRQASGPVSSEMSAPTNLPAGPEEPKQDELESDPFAVDDRAADPLTDPQRKKIYALRTKLLKAGAFTEESWGIVLSSDYGTENVIELTKGQGSTLIERLEKVEAKLPS